jgi:hypothetical protein
MMVTCINFLRFVTDDRRELYYRVEVQNRVYRREIAALDLEIGRLKWQLIESSNASSESTSEGVASKKVIHEIMFIPAQCLQCDMFLVVYLLRLCSTDDKWMNKSTQHL